MNKNYLRARNRFLREFLTLYLKPNSSVEIIRLGSDYGGWWVPKSVLKEGSLAYCAGAGEDITFDLELHKRGLKVTTFDPTPRAVQYVSERTPGPPFKFVPQGWWDSKQDLRFYAPKNPQHVSFSAVNLQETSQYFVASVDTVDSFIDRFGDSVPAIIKMDIEGAEYRVLKSMMENRIFPRCILVEFDQPSPVKDLISMVRTLEENDYSLVQIENWNYSFIRS